MEKQPIGENVIGENPQAQNLSLVEGAGRDPGNDKKDFLSFGSGIFELSNKQFRNFTEITNKFDEKAQGESLNKQVTKLLNKKIRTIEKETYEKDYNNWAQKKKLSLKPLGKYLDFGKKIKYKIEIKEPKLPVDNYLATSELFFDAFLLKNGIDKKVHGDVRSIDFIIVNENSGQILTKDRIQIYIGNEYVFLGSATKDDEPTTVNYTVLADKLKDLVAVNGIYEYKLGIEAAGVKTSGTLFTKKITDPISILEHEQKKKDVGEKTESDSIKVEKNGLRYKLKLFQSKENFNETFLLPSNPLYCQINCEFDMTELFDECGISFICSLLQFRVNFFSFWKIRASNH
jgi:hypothetical protein